ncbi:hypothetical protein BJ878DRAFT_99697 [Calycina marina]|uniref:Riboflavin kinase n=1 Tax=Calycina marina TaxID=1763456 RepID=A0A9P8CI75_9HELO|nr:hypothetical protein BJ878DRAFT_99697 [Calycina marina]
MGLSERPKIVGPDSGPEPPFPIRMKGTVVSGFGRGSKDLGIPTANLPVENVPWIDSQPTGVYFGWAGILLPSAHPALLHPSAAPPPPPAQIAAGWRTFPMVMSIGYNPFYKNTVRSAEVHVMHEFGKDFYGCAMAISILGYIRPELDYVSMEALIGDIRTDIEIAGTSLRREMWMRGDAYLWGGEES